MPKGKGKEKTATNDELFTVDASGDDGLRRQLLASTWDNPAAAHPRRGSGRPLRSEEILAQRSRVPARTSKVTPGIMVKQKKDLERRMKITPELKKRLRGMVTRKSTTDRGLLDVEVPRLQNTVVEDGDHDVWSTTPNLQGSLSRAHPEILEFVKPPCAKPPSTLHSHHLLTSAIAPQAIPPPHPGESYNPTFDDHQALLAAEHAKVASEDDENQKRRQVKESIMNGVSTPHDTWETGYADEVGSGEDDENIDKDTSDQQANSPQTKKQKLARRKTDNAKKRKQVNKMLEAHSRAESRLTKSQRQALSSLPHIATLLDSSSNTSLSELHKRKTMLSQRLIASGLSDLRSGPARVPRLKQAFLLSEELPESLRHLKTDGNLWNDYVDSLRRRGRVQTERRAYGRMMRQKGRGLKSVEKVKWRKFAA